MIKLMQQFVLQEDFLQELITPIKNKYTDIRFDINKSQKSNSLYLYLTKESTITAVRIADHENNYNHQKNEIIITPTTKCWRITKEVNQLAERLRHKRLHYLLKTINKGENE